MGMLDSVYVKCPKCGEGYVDYQSNLRKARADALEEAAKVADNMSYKIAVTIRALKDKP